MMRTLLTLATVFWATIFLAPLTILASMLRLREGPGSIYERAMTRWARWVNAAAGVTVVVHGRPQELSETGAVYVANHVSWFDVFAIAAVLPRYTFIAKAELRRLPIFGRGALAAGVVFLERENRKAAFESYRHAAADVGRGRNVVVYPEGTRGSEYPLRPFKKGPFVLAIAAQAPVVPTIVYGAREVMSTESWRIRPGTVHVHFLEPIPTAGLNYEDRGELMTRAWLRMADEFERCYGILSDGQPVDRRAG